MKSVLYSSVVAGLLTSGMAFSANLTGTVHFKGAHPKRELIKMNADPTCLKESKAKPVYKEDVVVNANGTLADVFVVVKDFKGAAPAAPTEPVSFDQTTCHYIPHVFGIRVGQPLKIINSDPVLHNVHAMGKANSPFNMGMPTKGQVAEKKFSKAEDALRIKCDVHGWMNAYAFVTEHPYFAVTDTTGNFTIANLPPGDYTIEAWQEKMGTKTEKVKVTDAGGKVDFTFGAGT